VSRGFLRHPERLQEAAKLRTYSDSRLNSLEDLARYGFDLSKLAVQQVVGNDDRGIVKVGPIARFDLEKLSGALKS